jgi:hypothetical protein
MSGAIPPFPHYVFMEWCLVKAQGLYLYLYLYCLIIIDKLFFKLRLQTFFELVKLHKSYFANLCTVLWPLRKKLTQILSK